MKKRIDICIPALNEEKIILQTLSELDTLANQNPEFDWHFIVVDNGSDDNTANIVLGVNNPRYVVIKLSNKGKGLAVREAALKSNADYFGYIDADLSASPSHLMDLVHELEKGSTVAVGSRLVDSSEVERSSWRTITSKLFNTYAALMVPVPISDTQCGLKVMDRKGREILADCKEDGWFFDREFIGKASKSNLFISELPIRWQEFHYPDRKSKLNLFRDGLASFIVLYRVRQSIKKYNYEN
jgi:glycosyltransferase involved in cell wall biosynthesis